MPSGPVGAEEAGWVYVQLRKGEVLLLAMRRVVPLWLISGAEWPCCAGISSGKHETSQRTHAVSFAE